MKNLKIFLMAAAVGLPVSAMAGVIDFETESGYEALGVFDTWAESPFRTGALQGNVAVVANPFAEEGAADDDETPLNPSEWVLGAQRSRLASNRFGVRIDLTESFKLTPQVQYVHVLIHKPIESRVMLIGLGSRTERTGQDPYTEQFWVLSSTAVQPDQWCDAVFAVKGAGGIDVRSLVVVPDCESPHALAEDFIFYVDDIEINSSSTPRITNDYYLVNGDKTNWKLDRTDRYTTSVGISGSADGNQTKSVTQQSDKLIYHDITDTAVFTARPGEKLSVNLGYNGTWMHSYFYIDFNNDGKFTPEISNAGTPTADSELVTYSFLGNNNGADNENGTNSTGATLTGSNRNVLKAPDFTLPADVAPGMYRVRFKVDWNSSDPGGNMGAGNDIDDNGGVIVDAMLHVHGETVTANDQQLNGEVLAADGSKLDALAVAYGEAFTVKMNPEHGFHHEGLTLMCGYNFDGKEIDRYGNRQYRVYTIPATDFTADGTYTIPANRMTEGNLLIIGNMVEDSDALPTDPFVVESEAGTRIYDLQGRKLKSANQAGLYIVNGEKVLKTK